MQTLPVILAVFVAAAAIIAVLLWRLKPQAVTDTQKTEPLQAKLDAKEADLRSLAAASAAAKATADAANSRADAADRRADKLKLELAESQAKHAASGPLASAAIAEKQAAEAARLDLDKQLAALSTRHDALQADYKASVEAAAAAKADAENKRRQIDDLAHTNEVYAQHLTAERAKLNQALAKQQSGEDAARHFENISQSVLKEILEQAKQSVGELADTFQKSSKEELASHAARVTQTLEPLQAQLTAYDAAVESLKKNTQENYGSLREQLDGLREAERALHDRAQALTTALSSTPKHRGQYGELALERLMEHAGLQEGPHFEKQARRHTEDGLKIPDMVVKMPGNQKVVIDAKAVMSAYVAAQEAQDDTQRKALLKKHGENVRSRVVELSAKNYFKDHSDAVELVVLFLPAENLYVAAVENDHDLADFAMSRNVVVCGPSLLIMLLKSASQLWRRASIEEEAQKIKQCGDAIYDAACLFIERYSKVGAKISQLEEAYNDAAGTLNGNLIPKSRNMGKFAAVSSNKEIEEVALLKEGVRPFSSPEARKILAASGKIPGLLVGDETAELSFTTETD